MTLTIGSLCSGYGGLTLAVQAVLGGRVAWHSEYEPPTPKNPRPSQAAARVLEARWPGVPNLGDMTAIDWTGVDPVDVYEGGTPCQDLSHAGKRAGMRAGTRSGLWASFVEGIAVLRPRLVIWENVRGVLSAEADSDLERCPICVGDGSGDALRALGRVLGDLADLGYDARWCGLRASDVGAAHNRFRVFVAAQPSGSRWLAERAHELAASGRGAADADPDRVRREGIHGRGEPWQAGGVGPADRGAADSERFERRPEPARELGRPDAALSGQSTWGIYGPAIRRWERILGREAPAPTRPGPKGAPKLSPEFDEWLMGLPAGWITDVPGISWNDMLKLCGNGVVPQQAAAAITHLLRGNEG